MTIGIIGNGFVGNSVYHTFSPLVDVKVYDINPIKSTHTLKDVVQQDVVFICVPTPLGSNGIDLSYVNDVVDTLLEIDTGDTVFVLKSTVIPGTTGRYSGLGLKIIFSPEFLTERTAVSDSICSNHVIIAGRYADEIERVVQLYKDRFGEYYNIMVTDYETAEFIKYMRNTFFATKVTFMNEMFRISTHLNIDWAMAVNGFVADGRIGHSHLSVPGHDGMYGYGGTCFPKDIAALVNMCADMGMYPILLSAVQQANLKYRGVEDWRSDVGRAVSN